MKLNNLLAQLNASANLSDEENPEVVLVDEYGTKAEIFEVAYNNDTNQLDILTYDRNSESGGAHLTLS